MNQQWFIAAISLLLLLLFAVITRILQNRYRSQRLLTALRDSLPAPLRVRGEERQGSTLAAFDPAPDPFRKLEAMLQLTRMKPQLILRGQLVQRPHQELLWERGRTPDRALRRSIDAGLWELRRIDLFAGNFAVRGTNTSALEHVFFDMQARFGAFLNRMSVQAEGEYEVLVALDAARFNEADLPALIATLRAMGRAGLR